MKSGDVEWRYCTAIQKACQADTVGKVRSCHYNCGVSTPPPIGDLGPPGPGTRATVIYNPVSGTRNVAALLPAAQDALRAYDWQVEVQATQRAGDLYRLAAQARDQRQAVVLIAGGDGSLNEAANALAFSETALGVLPGGTANVWARQIGLPVPSPLIANHLVDAARANATGVVRAIDLGRAGTRYFVLWSGVGLDAQVTAQIEPRPPWAKRFGIVGYAWRAFWIAVRYRGTRMDIRLDERRIRGRALMVLASNTQLYGGVLRAAPDARLDDGWLDVAIVKGGSFRELVRHAWYYLRQRADVDTGVIRQRAQHIRVRAKRPCYVHVDAEPNGRTPVDIDVVPQALRVIVPANAPRDLFAN